MGTSDDLPPSYNEAISGVDSKVRPSTSSVFWSPLSNHIRALPELLRQTIAARKTSQDVRDANTIMLMLPSVEDFLSRLSSGRLLDCFGNIPRISELTLVPAVAVPEGWELTGARERVLEGEVVEVSRVEDPAHTKDGKSSRQRPHRPKLISTLRDEVDETIDEWGWFETEELGDGKGFSGDPLWWDDEEMAKRLAKRLQPEPDLDRKKVHAIVIERKTATREEKLGWIARLGFGGSKSKKADRDQVSTTTLPSTPTSAPDSAEASSSPVKMIAKVGEVTFRKENQFGVWESRTGWGVVITIMISER
ncbi:uncharacterized protein CTHT_0019920 [Thermochaetoides thermophila DSM 1495]|uniref:Uncharacterized protein n=1 Tax=Chaetomium thermophilum (strain DSM 1495 / CBS 144.50 / IMI 039719) TaxID=759272 RepID=G0S371_CHATD|nr:hypothetical protein CTHT_0019920 [Thermochaetoides thermophila DSM 1495]EGS22454.1 hypothetical protein CTHT_0019920 [Thermochaetoides thermophila DSM 1495]